MPRHRKTTHDKKRDTLKHVVDVLNKVRSKELLCPAMAHDFIGIELITPRIAIEIRFAKPYDAPPDEKEGVVVRLDRYTFEPYAGRYYYENGKETHRQVDLTLEEVKALFKYFGITDPKDYYIHSTHTEPLKKLLLEHEREYHN